MGKDTNKPRVKGNLKPASSSRAADLVSNAATTLPIADLGGFAQFAGVSMSRSGSTDSSSFDNVGAVQFDPDLRVILKMTMKRDTTTKLKALEELEDYLKGKEEGDTSVGAMLELWTKIYIKLTIDVDRRVRVLTNSVHLQIVHNMKKKFAPHLKDVIGAWVCSFFDQYVDVAKLAKEAYQV
ncbi:hypothetical protein BC936DRAFT_146315 [Jimgerdemannia flammicorona]|uniref:E3 ubiquitin-protein ligase listerin n=1 Tax=Jimgerdemannia flammicorona TaxID=994334 RepID=A0A433D8N6_9FUNG|nr:hypothetical protein BC936DRAFT_146315 [Jimgerdemannia flammicorona]